MGFKFKNGFQVYSFLDANTLNFTIIKNNNSVTLYKYANT